MMTMRREIEEWFDHGVAIGATHMLVVCDTYDYDDYPKYIMPGQDVRALSSSSNLGSMQRLMEVYNLNMDKFSQLAERRSFNY